MAKKGRAAAAPHAARGGHTRPRAAKARPHAALRPNLLGHRSTGWGLGTRLIKMMLIEKNLKCREVNCFDLYQVHKHFF